MAIKSGEKIKNAVVSKKMPSLRISRKQDSSKPATSKSDTSIIDVSSKKSKRAISRKISRKSNNEIKPEVSEIQETENIVLPEIQETSNLEITTNEAQINKHEENNLENNIVLEEVLEKDSIISEPTNEVSVSEDTISTVLVNSNDNEIKDNIMKVEKAPKSKSEKIAKSGKKSVSKTTNDTAKSKLDNAETTTVEVSDNINKETVSHTVIKPNYMVHRTKKSRRTISLNLDKNIDELVAPVIKEKDVSINQNAPFFYEPSVFQKFNIDVIDADSEQDLDEIKEEVSDEIKNVDTQNDVQETVSAEVKNNDTQDEVQETNSDEVKVDDTKNEVQETISDEVKVDDTKNEVQETISDEVKVDEISTSSELIDEDELNDALLKELINEAFGTSNDNIQNEVKETVSDEVKNDDIQNEVQETISDEIKNDDIQNEVQETVSAEVKNDDTQNEVKEIVSDEVKNDDIQNEVQETVSDEVKNDDIQNEVQETVSDEVKNDDIQNEVQETISDEIKNDNIQNEVQEIASDEVKVDKDELDDALLDELINEEFENSDDISNIISIEDLISSTSEELEDTTTIEPENNIEIIDSIDDIEIKDIDNINNNDENNIIEKQKESEEHNEEVLKEVAGSITTPDVKKVDTIKATHQSTTTFFDSSIPKLTSESVEKNISSFTKKPTFSSSSNIFKKFTFDEAGFKTGNLGVPPVQQIAQDPIIDTPNVLNNLESSKKSINELEVSASPTTLLVPTLDVDTAQFNSNNDTDLDNENVTDFYNIITPNSLDTDDTYEENYVNDAEDVEKANTSHEIEDTITESDIDITDIDINDISIDDLELLDNMNDNNSETLASTIDETEIDENYINENPIHDDLYFDNSDEEEIFDDFEISDDNLEAENYDFENKKMSNYYTEDDEFSIEDYFGLNDLKDEDLDDEEPEEDLESVEELLEEDTDGIELDVDENAENDFAENFEKSNPSLSSFSKLIENFTQTISTLSERIADLEENKNNVNNNSIKEVQNEDSNIEDEEIIDAISPTDIVDSDDIELDSIDEAETIIDDNNTNNIFEDVSIEDLDISLEDIDDISLEDIENTENVLNTDIADAEKQNIENDSSNSDKDISNNQEETVEFDLPLNDNGVEEPNLFDTISTDDINLDDFSLEDLVDIETTENENPKAEDTKAVEDILTQTFSSENSNINAQMKEELLSELANNADLDKALLDDSNADVSSDDATSDFFKIIDTLTKTITQLESSPNMETKPQNTNTQEILNVPAELTGEGKAINILINKDDIFSISILNETYEIVADFDGISVLSENIHISTPKKNFFVKVGEKYIEIHNKNDNFLVYTNFEDIEFANAINNVAFAKKNNKIELNIKEAFKLSSVNNKVELSMLNTTVANIVNANQENSENIDETSICDNRTLLISEETQKVYLPYTIEEVMKKLNNSNEYQTVEEVIENEYTVPLSDFKMPIISRFKEAYKFMRVKEKSSVYAAVDLALELMFTSNLNPAVIRAAKDLKELNIYLDCLYENEVEKFDCFKVIYKVLPKIK